MRPDRPLPHLVDPQLGELTAYPLPQLPRERELVRVVVDVDVEAAAGAVRDRRHELRVSRRPGFRGRVAEGFAVVVEVAEEEGG